MSKVKIEDVEISGGYNILMLKAEEGNVEEVHRILTDFKHVDPSASNKKGYTALALAIKAGHVEVAKLLIESGSDPNKKNNSGQSPLFLACWNNHYQIVKLLLDNGAEINAVDNRGWTPLMIAAYHGHKQIVRELYLRNADTSIQDLFGKKAIDRAKDLDIIKILQGIENTTPVASPTPKSRKKDILRSTQIASSVIEHRKQASLPSSILKKSSSKVSVSVSKLENECNKTIPSPHMMQSTGFSYQNSPSASSVYQKTAEVRKPNSQIDTRISTQKETIQSDRKSPLVLSTLHSDSVTPKNGNTKRIPSPPAARFERQMFKEDMEKLLSEQMDLMCKKIQQIIECKIALEIPMQMQNYEKDLKSQLESLLRFKAADIFKNLQAMFNLKLKFCITRLGYDTTDLGLTPVLEDETTFNVDNLKFNPEPLKTYDKKEFIAIKNDAEKLEKSILSYKIPQSSTAKRSRGSAVPEEHQCDHTGQVHRIEIRNELIDHMGQEVRSTTEHLLDYSSFKVNEMTRQESNSMYKKILAEVSNNMEVLEGEIKARFEEVISHKIEKIFEVIGSASQQKVPADVDVRSVEKNAGANQKSYFSTISNTSEVNYRSKHELEGDVPNNKDLKFFNTTELNHTILSNSVYSDRKGTENRARGQQEISQAKEKIMRIKNSLNFMDDGEVEQKVERKRQIKSANNVESLNRAVEGETEETPRKGSEEVNEEVERIYNPNYRSTLATEQRYKTPNEAQEKDNVSRTRYTEGQSQQYRSSNRDIKNNARPNQLPGHRFPIINLLGPKRWTRIN